jgi:pyruvate kinase
MAYKIIATLGPTSNSTKIWGDMISVGVTGFRLNTSHMSITDLEEWLQRLEVILEDAHPKPELVLDLQGSKWRLGRFETRELIQGQLVELRLAASSQFENILPVPHPDFFQAAPASSVKILLNDAKVQMEVISTETEKIKAQVVQGGEISAMKGITFSESSFRKESLSEKDQQIIEQTLDYPYIRYAISYVKDGSEMRRYRSMLGDKAYLIAKLERKTAIEEAVKISEHSDELWLCRGDLGSEMGMKLMAEVVYNYSQQIRDYPIPILLAGQVLEHMVEKPAPTRSEVSVLYESLERGFSGFVLSDETAVGRYPVESCRTAALFHIP